MNWAIHRERPRRGRLLGLLASTVLVLLVVGLPVWLAATAGPPSVHLDVGGLWQALVHHQPGDVRQVAGWLGRAALLLAWIAWAWLTLCVVLEVAAWRSGRSPVRLPASRSIQCAAALLVGTAFAVGSLGRIPVYGDGPFRAVPVVQGSPTTESHATVVGSLRPANANANANANADADADAAAADGDVSAGAPPHRAPIDRGVGRAVDRRRWEPAVRSLDPPSPTGAAATADRRHTVAARESLWSIAEQHLGAARRWRDIAELNYGRPQAGGGALARDHWLQPGWELFLPTDTGSSSSVEPRPGWIPSTADAVPGPAVGPPSAGGAAPVGAPAVPGGTPALPVGGGIVGIGVADLVDRLRKVQQRHRLRGAQIRLPDQLLRPFEQRLRLDDGAGDLEAVESAVLALDGAPGGWPRGCRLTGATVHDGQVRLVFDVPPPGDVPRPFTVADDRVSLVVDRAALGTVPGLRRSDRHRFPAPTLVTVGRAAGDLVMLDLEGLGALVVAGDPVDAEGLGRAMALELASSRWASAFDLVLVGFGAALAHGERVTVVGDAGPVIADLTWRRLTMSVRLDGTDEPSVDAARRTDRAGDWRPIVVVCAPVVPGDHVAAILDLASDGHLGICAVAMAGAHGPPPSAVHVLRAGTGLDVLGTVVETQSIDGGEFDQAVRLIETAAHLDAGAPDEGGGAVDGIDTGDTGDTDDTDGGIDDTDGSIDADDGSDTGPGTVDTGTGNGVAVTGGNRSTVASYRRPTSATTTRVDAGSTGASGRAGDRASNERGRDRPDRSGIEVEVAVLGTVEVHGAARKFTRAWALELVVYLAMHPGGATNEAWATALWPDRLMAPSSLHSTVSVARRALGPARDGTDHLPRSHGRLALAPTVGTDWARFQALAASDDPDRWEAALSIVRGRPFEGIRATDWSLLDGTAPSIESAVVDLSGRLAGARLRSGDPHGAEWAARKGLLVSPYDERLYRMLLRTADAAGNPSGVETVMAELVRVVSDEVEPVESVHPSTLALYRSLSRRSRSVVDVPVRG